MTLNGTGLIHLIETEVKRNRSVKCLENSTIIGTSHNIYYIVQNVFVDVRVLKKNMCRFNNDYVLLKYLLRLFNNRLCNVQILFFIIVCN